MPRMKYKYKEKHNYNKGSFYCKKIVLHHKLPLKITQKSQKWSEKAKSNTKGKITQP